jgi:DNA-binding CsgD family transcriptional regulator/tetratricopeptide (TPR) repeat protein
MALGVPSGLCSAIRHPVPLHQGTIMSAALGKSLVCPILVGRGAYLEAMRRCMREVTAGSGQLVLLSGEAGIGKSRLVAEVGEQCVAAGWQRVEGHCFEPDRSLAYGPLLDLLRAYVARHPQGELADELGLAAPELVKLLPELAALLREVAPSPPLDPEQEKRRLFEALAHLLLRLATVQPALVVLEDLHWCDDTTLEFLAMLARRLATRRILLVLTYRSDEVHAGLHHFLAEMDRARLANECWLGPLAREDVEAMVRAIFQLERPVRPDFVDTLFRLTEGNPFFIEETLKSLTLAGDIYLADGRWERKDVQELRVPRSVQDAVRRRTTLISDEARALVAVAAVVGQRFDFALMQRLSGHDELELLRLLKEMIAAQLVVEVSADRFQFRHALTRQAIYTQVLARERRALHRTIGLTIEQVYAEALESHLAELAYHFYEAEDWERALDYSYRVGERSLTFFAPRAAREHFTHALDAARHLGQPPRAAVYLGRGKASDTLGDFEHARRDFEAALEAAHAEEDQAMEWQALLALGLLWAGRDYARAGEYYRRAYELAQAMDDPLALAESLNRIGNWHLNRDDTGEAVRCHEQALEIFRRQGSRRGEAESEDLLGIAGLLDSAPARGAVAFDRAIAAWRELGERELLSSSLATRSICGLVYHMGLTYAIAPDRSLDVPLAEEALSVAREIGWRAGEAFALFALGTCVGPRGEWGRALAALKQASRVAESIDHRQWMLGARWGLGCVYADAQAWADAHVAFERAWALAHEVDSYHWMRMSAGALAEVCIARGDLERATSVLDEALPASVPMRSYGQRRSWYGRAELALAAGWPEEALRLAHELGARLDALDTPHGPDEPDVVQARFLAGRALARMGRADEAVRALEGALATTRALGWRSLEWQVAVSLVPLLLERGAEEAARNVLTEAGDLISALAHSLDDAPLREGFLRAALTQLPVDQRDREPQRVRGARDRRRDGLTPREREVAALVAQGLSNRAIAEVLVLSERTVESHVTNILGKRGFSTRAQIAVWVVETGASDDSGE